MFLQFRNISVNLYSDIEFSYSNNDFFSSEVDSNKSSEARCFGCFYKYSSFKISVKNYI
jgi:hypothetical protein